MAVCFIEESITHKLSFNYSAFTYLYPWTLSMSFPKLSLSLNTAEKKRDWFVYQSHILLCDITLLPFIHLSRQSQNHECVCVSAQGAVYLWRPVICLSVCVFVTKLVLQTHWTKWHVLTHFYLGLIICRTHSYRTLSIYPGLSPSPPLLIRVFVGVSDVLFILDLQCVCRAVERELILCW